MTTNKKKISWEEKFKSKCCNADIDYRGGGYDGEEICPIEDYCSKCKQTLKVNGIGVIHDNQ